MKAPQGKISGLAIVRDKHGRIVVDDSIFHDEAKLEKLRQEVLKNGRNPSCSNP